MTTALVDLDAVDAHTMATRALHRRMSQAKPLVRLWANPPDGEYDRGLILRGVASDNQAGSFPFTKKDVATGTLKLRRDHFLADWLLSIPEDDEAKKNVVITVGHMGMQWSGLMKSWKITKDAQGILYLEVTFADDRQMLDFLLGPPNPALPIPVFQFPRVLPIFGPTIFAVQLLILMNIMRVQGNWWTLPDDPSDWESWASGIDMRTWQCFVNLKPLLDDPSLFTVLATRMDIINSVITDAMDDAQVVLAYHRIMTVDGEDPADYGVPFDVRNGALVFSVEDKSGYYKDSGTWFGGNLLTGMARSAIQFLDGFVESVLTTVSDDEHIWPDEYYQTNFWGCVPSHPWIVLRDSRWSSIETSELGYSPASAVSVVVGGDNPYADQMAELLIQSVGNILGYFALGGFSSAGDIAASVIMPFLVGTIAAWLHWKNFTRAQQLGWVHLWETFGQGGESNAWSLSAIAALRAAFEATSSKTTHKFTMGGDGPIYPGLHMLPGDRVGSTAEKIVRNKVFVDHVEVMDLSWDYAGGNPTGHHYDITIGTGTALMSISERNTRSLAKALDTIQNIGVHLIS